MTHDTNRIAAEILRLVGERGTSKSICPSEVARALDPAWRPLLGPVRQVAARLSDEGQIDILRKGRPVSASEMHGVIRLRLRDRDGGVSPVTTASEPSSDPEVD